MRETALVIMAAGIGSRYGAGIKQLAKVGPSGEILLDYSIYDAVQAGFNKVIFIIRKDIEADFKEIIGNRVSKYVKVEYAFQDLHDLPEGYTVPDGRTKPWGTGQAVYAARDLIDCPFIVINADDYYGPDGFRMVHDFLASSDSDVTEDGKMRMCMAGYIIGNTLSEHGSVARGVCEADEAGMLQSVTETYDLMRRDGVISGHDSKGNLKLVSESNLVSMNMWGLPAGIIEVLGERFPTFLENIAEGDLKSEYLLPMIIDSLIKEGAATCAVLKTHDKWYGMTYQEDREYVAGAIADMIKNGVYKENLFA